MIRRLAILSLVLSLSACGAAQGLFGGLGIGKGSTKRAVLEFDGVRYKAKADASREDRRAFTITVTPAAGNPEAAQEAGRYEATRYCLLTFGGSDAIWTIGPDTPLEELQVIDNTLSLQGRCTQR